MSIAQGTDSGREANGWIGNRCLSPPGFVVYWSAGRLPSMSAEYAYKQV